MADREQATGAGAAAHAEGIARDGAEDDSRRRAEAVAQMAASAVAEAVQRIALQAGGEITGEQPRPGSADTIRRVSAAAGLRAAHRLELAARQQIRDSIRFGREDGLSWHEIGALLEVGADAADRGVLVAEAAFSIATGPGRHTWAFEPVTFRWTCRACGNTISDHGPGGGSPDDDEPGHAGNCPRLIATWAAWDAAWTQE